MNALRNETITTTINGIEVELELYDERGEQRSDCSLSYKSGRCDWSASLAMAEANGYLDPNHSGEEGDEEPYELSSRTLGRILEWAEENGY